MPPLSCPTPGLLAPGDVVDLADPAGRDRVRATVLEDAGTRIVLRLADRLHAGASPVHLRRIDDGVWTAEGIGRVADEPLTVEVDLSSEWVESAGRAAARFPADRRLVRVRATPPPEAHDLIALDVSATGCRLSGSGRAPEVGTHVVADISASSYARPTRIRAIVVRVDASAFRRFVLGLRFDPRTPSERALILRWRDECAAAAAHRPLELVAD